jgi:hypothetical protein
MEKKLRLVTGVTSTYILHAHLHSREDTEFIFGEVAQSVHVQLHVVAPGAKPHQRSLPKPPSKLKGGCPLFL